MNEPTAWDGERHLHLLTTMHWAAAGLFGIAFLFTSFAIGVDLPFLPFAVLPLVALHVAAALGMMQRDNWGRIVSIIAAALSLFSFPIGTAFAVYAFVVHSRADVKSLFTGENP